MSSKKIGIIGSGTMGSGIVQLAAVSGCEVMMYDTVESALKKAVDKIQSTFKMLVEKNKMSEEDVLMPLFQELKLRNHSKNLCSATWLLKQWLKTFRLKKTCLKSWRKFAYQHAF